MNNITEERLLRFSHLKSSGGTSHAVFLAALDKHIDLSDSILPFYHLACNTDYTHPGLNKGQYLSHPLRVATLALEEFQNPSLQVIATSLLHNLKEVSINSFNALSSSVPCEICQAIEVLTIDRARAQDSDYLTSYYDLISCSPDFVGVVKVLDKLDNMFLLCLNSSGLTRDKYIDEIELFVLPLARLRVPHLVRYIELLALDCREVGFIDLADDQVDN